MAVCDKNIRYTKAKITNRKSLEAKLFPDTEQICGQPGFVLKEAKYE